MAPTLTVPRNADELHDQLRLRGDLVVNGRDMSIYERPVHSHSN